MKGLSLEGFLARLYSDPGETLEFLADRATYLKSVGLAREHWVHALSIDAGALRFAVASYQRKRCSTGHA